MTYPMAAVSVVEIAMKTRTVGVPSYECFNFEEEQRFAEAADGHEGTSFANCGCVEA